MARWFLTALLAAVAALPVVAATSVHAVTFYRQIAPIIYKNCAPCHRPGEAGPFSLLTYEDMKRRASQIAAVTKRRYMPPWLPEPGHGDFIEERRLSDAQIQLIQEWVKQGAPAGPIPDAPAAPQFTSEAQPGTPHPEFDHPQPYQLSPDGPGVFWRLI